MKLVTALTAAAFAFAVHAAAPEVKYTPGKYQVDTAHSKVGFTIPHMVISSVDGDFKTFEGTVDLAEKFEKSTVKATVDMNSIDTGNSKRDDHLRSPDFFDVKKFPKMTFNSTSIKGTPESFKLNGKLTLHGVTKDVEFDSKMLGSINDGFGNERAAFTATTVIKRADYGLTWNKAIEAGPVVGDTLTVTLKVEATHALPKKEK